MGIGITLSVPFIVRALAGRRATQTQTASDLRATIKAHLGDVVRSLIPCAVKSGRGVHPFVTLMPNDGSSWALIGQTHAQEGASVWRGVSAWDKQGLLIFLPIM
jgi:hypothetical protein